MTQGVMARQCARGGDCFVRGEWTSLSSKPPDATLAVPVPLHQVVGKRHPCQCCPVRAQGCPRFTADLRPVPAAGASAAGAVLEEVACVLVRVRQCLELFKCVQTVARAPYTVTTFHSVARAPGHRLLRRPRSKLSCGHTNVAQLPSSSSFRVQQVSSHGFLKGAKFSLQ